MKSYFKLTLLCILVAFIAGCSETYEIKQAPIPSMSDYNGYLNVKNTDGKFVSETLTNTRLPAGTYKIILFPNSIQFKTLYVIADTQGKITFDGFVLTIEPNEQKPITISLLKVEEV